MSTPQNIYNKIKSLMPPPGQRFNCQRPTKDNIKLKLKVNAMYIVKFNIPHEIPVIVKIITLKIGSHVIVGMNKIS